MPIQDWQFQIDYQSKGRERFDETCNEPRNTTEAQSINPDQQVKHHRQNFKENFNVTTPLRERRPNKRPKRLYQKVPGFKQ